MQKTKIATLLLGYLVGLVILARPVHAAPTVSIAKLPEYVTVDHFKLSCTALGGINAQFAYKKEGGSYSNFGPAIDLISTPCLVDVTSTQIDSQAKYYFRVDVDGVIAETSTIYDVSGPGEPGGFSKERLGPTTYRIKWHTPNNDDFGTVVIYRGEKSDIEANSGAEVARVGGNKDTDYEWVDNGVESGKDYYYVIRALDRAGNSSGLVGDSELTAVLGISTSAAQVPSTGTKVTTLPKEQVLSKETESPTPTPTSEELNQGLVGTAAQAIGKNRTVGIIIGVVLLGVAAFLLLKKRAK